MPRKESEAFPEINDPIPHYVMHGITLEDLLPWRQTCKHTPRLASARMASLKQSKRCMGIALLQKGSKTVRRARPV